MNSTAIFVEWKSPANGERNGIIRGYQVHYVQLNHKSESIGSPRIFDTANGQVMDAVIIGLKSDTKYQVVVRAYTRKGDGNASRPKIVTTMGAGNWLCVTYYIPVWMVPGL